MISIFELFDNFNLVPELFVKALQKFETSFLVSTNLSGKVDSSSHHIYWKFQSYSSLIFCCWMSYTVILGHFLFALH